MTRPNPHIALIYHYDLARALAGEVVDWQAIPVNVDAGREGGDLCRQAADFAKRRDLFAMPAPSVGPLPAFSDTEKEAPALPPGVTREQYGPTLQPGDVWDLPAPSAVPVGPNPTVEQQAADPEPSTASTAVPGTAATDKNEEACSDTTSTTRLGPTPTALSSSSIAVPSPTAPANTSTSSPTASSRLFVSTFPTPTTIPWQRDRLRARIANLITAHDLPSGRSEIGQCEYLLRRHWPEGVPTLKHDGHSDAQLQLILACVRRVEAEVGAGWHPDDGPPQHVNTDPRASIEYPVAVPDEGGIAGAPETFALDLRYNALTPAGWELCHQLATEAHAAGRSISVTADPTMRKVRIARAVIAWAESGRTLDELWFAASNLATFEQCRDPSATLGGLISQFTISQADRLYDAASQ